MENHSKLEALTHFFAAMDGLRNMGILTNQKDFTGQLGEWLIEVIFDGKRAKSGVQEGWDVDISGHRIQVKAHAKNDTNTTSWTPLANPAIGIADELIIVVFSKAYKLKAFYRIPWEQAVQIARTTVSKKNGNAVKHKIHWKDIARYSQDIGTLPKQDVISFFLT